MDTLLHKPGFLGTHANLAADVTLLIMLTVAALFSIGFALAARPMPSASSRVPPSSVVRRARGRPAPPR